jgi:hypothetical protein
MKPYQQINHQTYLLNNHIGNNLTTSSYLHQVIEPIVFCKNVLNLFHATSQNMHKYDSNIICDACNNDPLFCEI